MKKAIFTSILALLIATGTTVRAQENSSEYLGLPGDNLNLYAVMSLFQESETLEGFERNLNEQDSRVNNLDLNGDNFVDYIMVTDYVDGTDHNIVLSVALNSNERQDVGVFTVQKLRNGEVEIQLIGDEELYGRNYIIEPIYADNNGETPNPGYNGQNVTVERTTYYEVAAWPMIRFIYRPDYVVWRSSWRWGYYPSYWEPWSPFYYHHYYGYYSNWYPEYYRHYRHSNQPRYTRYNTFYYSSVRSHSPSVSVRIREGNYKNTYSRPESRRDGEALYKSTRTGSDARPNRTSTTTRTNARTNTNSDTRTINNTGTSRRSNNPATVNTRSNSSSGQDAATSRRQTTTSSDRAAAKPAPASNRGTVSRSRETTTKTATPASNRGTVNRSRETTTKTAAPASNSGTVNRSRESTTTKASAPSRSATKSAAPARTNTKASKSKSSSKGSGKAKEKETTTTTKRR